MVWGHIPFICLNERAGGSNNNKHGLLRGATLFTAVGALGAGGILTE